MARELETYKDIVRPRPSLRSSLCALGRHVVDDDFPFFFGVKVKPADLFEKFEQAYGFDYFGDQIFESAHYLPIVTALQEGVQAGQGAVHRSELTTVENARWGIKAGEKFNVTWVYLARVSQGRSKENSLCAK